MSVFQKLTEVDISKLAERKGKYDYLSWAHAVREMLKVYPEATWRVHEYDNQPYMETSTGFYVKVTVGIGDVCRTQIHPVLDNKNNPIAKPTSFQINTSIQRCLAKTIALHGLGLVLFAGEDLPDVITEEQEKEITKLAEKIENEAERDVILKAIENGNVNESNYEKSLEHCKTLIKNQKGEKNG
tara:strand:- start:13 stop:567 length:555 start_codon:yes stop_codon:yes gene_type:complete